MYTAIPHLSPIGLSVIHQADEKHVDVTFQRMEAMIAICAACIATLRPLFTQSARKRSEYARFSDNSHGLTNWPGHRIDGVSGTNSKNVTAVPKNIEDIAVDKIYEIRKIVDIDVSA